MKKIIKKRLLSDLEKLDQSNLANLNIDKQSFKSGYSNGFVKGYYLSNKLMIWLVIMLIISFIFNIMS